MAAFQKTRFSSLLHRLATTYHPVLYHRNDPPPFQTTSADEQRHFPFRHIELDNGGLMVSFTFSETVDTILPVAPETLYEIEGETISLWALTFVSLTKEENLGFLEYHKALKQLQPYIVETRGDHILVRGLSLAEMEHILAKQ